MSDKVVKLDVRIIPHSERTPKKILDEWNRLEPGETLQIINDHDPKTLYNLFNGEFSGAFSWEYGEQGPVDWVVNIKKLKKA